MLSTPTSAQGHRTQIRKTGASLLETLKIRVKSSALPPDCGVGPIDTFLGTQAEGRPSGHRRHQPLSQSGGVYQRLESPDKSQYTECFPAKWKTLTRLWERFPQETSPSRFWRRLGDSLDIYPTWVGSNIIVLYYGDVWNAPVVQTSIPDGHHLLNQFNNLITKDNAPLFWAVLLHLHTIPLQKLP